MSQRDDLTLKSCIWKCKVCPSNIAFTTMDIRLHKPLTKEWWMSNVVTSARQTEAADMRSLFLRPTRLRSVHDPSVLRSCGRVLSTPLASFHSHVERTTRTERTGEKTYTAKVPAAPDDSSLRQNLPRMVEHEDEKLFIDRTVASLDGQRLSLRRLLRTFRETGSSSADHFLEYARKVTTEDLCRLVERCTRSQSDTSMWHELRRGRITASSIYEAVRCKTFDGSFVRRIVGASSTFVSEAMERGKRHERKILSEVGRMTGLRLQDCGLFLVPSCPALGASPDALGDDFIVEVKCPSTSKAFDRFLPSGRISAKCKAQINMQMFATGKRRGLLCVADPNFEESKRVTIVWEKYDEAFTNSMIENAVAFWKRCIFAKLYKSKDQ